MSDFDLFAMETLAADASRQVLANPHASAADYRQALGTLLTHFERLVRETRRMISQSDRREAEMNQLNARLGELARRDTGFLPPYLAAAIKAAGPAAVAAPELVVPAARRVFRQLVGDLILDTTGDGLTDALARARAARCARATRDRFRSNPRNGPTRWSARWACPSSRSR